MISTMIFSILSQAQGLLERRPRVVAAAALATKAARVVRAAVRREAEFRCAAAVA
jgi:hypothetical protein